MRYVQVLEGTIGRIDKKQIDNNIGLCTDNITTCNVLILRSQDKQRLVLMHADKTFKSSHIENQLKWLGDKPDAVLFYREETSKLILTKLKKSKINCKTQYINEDEEAIVLESDGTVKKEKDLPKTTLHHPYSILMYIIHRLELAFSVNYNGYSNPLIYDSEWTKACHLSLSEDANKNFIISKEATPAEILKVFEPVTNEINRLTLSSDLYFYLYLEKLKSTFGKSLANADIDPNQFKNYFYTMLENDLKFSKFKDYIQQTKKLNNTDTLLSFICSNGGNSILQEINLNLSVYGTVCDNYFEKMKPDLQSFLKEKTQTFFPTTTKQWKAYPADKLVGKYIGHQLLFFNMSEKEAEQSANFVKQLNEIGFNAEKKGTQSVVVDLTESKVETSLKM